MKKVAWLPENLNGNRSIYQFKKSIELAGAINVSEKDFRAKMKDADYLILNFYEDIQKKIGFYSIAFIGRFIRLLKFRIAGVKILWFLNNKVPHDDNAKWAIRMMRILVKYSYKIICLCQESEVVLRELQPNEKVWKSKLIFLPHPNYIGAYKEYSEVLNPEKFTALFFGAVRPYKNVDTLIKTFSELPQDKVHLVIAGKAKKSEYKKYIEQLAKNNPGIELKLEYINDDEILKLIKNSSVVVLPYDRITTLNSGSVLLCCTAKKTFICPEIGTVKDFKDKSLFYSYNYDDVNQHSKALNEAILKAYNDYQKDSFAFCQKGIALFEYVEKEHSVEKLAEIWKKSLCL